MKNRTINFFLYLIEVAGSVFLAIFLAVYLFALPSIDVLHGEPFSDLLLSIFGGIFLILIAIIILIRIAKKN
jgi:hypothetical protein